MPEIDPDKARRFAYDVVERLRAEGFEALWAGGCVRDFLLDRQPKDYDVATSATPAEIRQVFGRHRTLAIGAAFGVIAVLGPTGAGQIEVATFRRDAQYSDGRHPDSVAFTTAEEDAQRRDFTINALFFDPASERVIDYVGGVEDLNRKLIRAVGDPRQRIAEDKLRMLRAVRFAATFDFDLDEPTLAAVVGQAHEIVIVSAERVAEEMRRMLTHANRVRAIELLQRSGLLEVVLPESAALAPQDEPSEEGRWRRTLRVLGLLADGSFALALAALLREIDATATQRKTVVNVCRRWRLPMREMEEVVYLLQHEGTVRAASNVPWSKLQRLLTTEGIEQLLEFAEAVAHVADGGTQQIEFCRERLALPAEQLNPPPLIDGNDLKAEGIVPGPDFKMLLDTVRDAQLLRRLSTRQEALQMVHRLRADADSAEKPGE